MNLSSQIIITVKYPDMCKDMCITTTAILKDIFPEADIFRDSVMLDSEKSFQSQNILWGDILEYRKRS